MTTELLPPAQPAFILRGHSAHIHALHFTHGNTRLLTGDAEGWIVSWNLAIKRPVAVWKAHDNAILAVGSWSSDRIITHGRDHKLRVWQLGLAEESTMDRTLPVDAAPTPRKQPWLFHALPVNTLNFCAFAVCRDGIPQIPSSVRALQYKKAPYPVLIAVPNTVDSGGIDIYQLPSEHRAAGINADKFITTGMVMALNILAESTKIQVAAGYESGHTMVFVQNDPGAPFQKLYSANPHTQPVLSITIAPSKDHFITSSADAMIAKHPLPICKSIWNTELKPLKVIQTKHSGQQGLQYRSDGKIFATAGWDAHTRVYSGKTMKELAVLKWHKVGCYGTAFAAVEQAADRDDAEDDGQAANEQSSVVKTVPQRRDQRAQGTHWLAVGAKDGKVSLWDIY
ncbi:MAG: ASTRA complex subunit [Alectoria sarmentosa]|nr:MAG: ASTRA complex subunit [Alectoria sarmentosa]